MYAIIYQNIVSFDVHFLDNITAWCQRLWCYEPDSEPFLRTLGIWDPPQPRDGATVCWCYDKRTDSYCSNESTDRTPFCVDHRPPRRTPPSNRLPADHTRSVAIDGMVTKQIEDYLRQIQVHPTYFNTTAGTNPNSLEQYRWDVVISTVAHRIITAYVSRPVPLS